ncbi:uncharacterized protein LOC129757876 [Uranotaenia lowii]|uniref:uncharacterized protein LOC129757876 n=1 Tax=Uranotaenia lowii TaxID=190385 RepID=UPI00247AA287|nr:uncharacterized protein LOC129757876 [Uranotaenia lowii]
MFAVVQFIENNKFQVLAVPTSWIQKNVLMWPKLSVEKIERLRVSGSEFNGPTKRIPVIVWRKLRNFKAAEKAAEELARKEVSDVEGKKKLLKPEKKPKLIDAKNYNLMCAALQNPPPNANRDPQCNFKPALDHQQTQNLPSQKTTPSPSPLSITHVPLEQATFIQVPQTSSALSLPVVQQPIVTPQRNAPQVHQAETYKQTTSLPLFINQSATTPPDQFAETTSTHYMQQKVEPMYCSQNDIYFLSTDSATGYGNLDKHVIAGGNDTVTYGELKKDLQQFIQTTMEATVQKCFEDHFARLAALMEIHSKHPSESSEPFEDPVENHKRINNECELHDWNLKLGNQTLCDKYLTYFTRIIPPSSYHSNGNNACYTIVDCLFTRDFWTRFTWTGINRGEKSKRGFREFGNVLHLLLKLVCIGDPTYTAQKLEDFIRSRLFRYCKPRSSSKKLRRSATRPSRIKYTEENPVEAMDAPESASTDVVVEQAGDRESVMILGDLMDDKEMYAGEYVDIEYYDDEDAGGEDAGDEDAGGEDADGVHDNGEDDGSEDDRSKDDGSEDNGSENDYSEVDD